MEGGMYAGETKDNMAYGEGTIYYTTAIERGTWKESKTFGIRKNFAFS